MDIMKQPLLALVGRPNVGKSTLYNALTRSNDSLVSDVAGLTRDRQYGEVRYQDLHFRVVDTGGMLRSEEEVIDVQVDSQARQAIDEADAVAFLVDGREGLNPDDLRIAHALRRQNKPVLLLVNKTDFADPHVSVAEFYELGLGEPLPIAAAHRRGLNRVVDTLRQLWADRLVETEETFCEENVQNAIKLAVVGRPNVGKSTLINALIDEERLVASDIAGTTRDSIAVPFQALGRDFVLIDTAGVRRRARVQEKIEKFSVIKTLESIERAHVVLLVLDAHEGIAEQDAHLLGLITRAGRSLVIAVNKWDDLEPYLVAQTQAQLERKLNFVDYAEIHYISAKNRKNLKSLLPAVQRAHRCAMIEFNTNQLTQTLQEAYIRHQPPLVAGGKHIKMQYAHQGGKNPPTIIIHGSRLEHVPQSYTQYLMNYFRKAYRLSGTPIRIEYRSKSNPYAPS